MATVHLFAGRRWTGWYNSPGAYEVAKQYGQIANSRFWDGLFPGAKCEPAELFGLDGRSGPPFFAARSGSSFPETPHLAHLIARRARNMDDAREVKGRRTRPESVTVVDLPFTPDTSVQPRRLRRHSGMLAVIPIAASFATCVLCALVGDWFCFGSIALGIVASGIACVIIGSGKLTFTHPTPARGVPWGDGILVDKDSGVVVLRGKEAAVNSITRGRFSLEYDGHPKFGAIGHCSVLLTLQFLVQLLLIPQGTLYGQIMFITSLAVSWVYNTYLSSIDREDLQTTALMDILKVQDHHLSKFVLHSRTAVAVFSCLSLQPHGTGPIHDPRKILDVLIPNDTNVWTRWKGLVVDKLLKRQPMQFSDADWKLEVLDEEESELLQQLLEDARDAYEGWEGGWYEPPMTVRSA
ncbi:hypothetical protein C8Q80DRAFT_1218494 [Daedaleopsis nitida]|nr:hypothetical protein C8Q80DRAFT_1218494 [Daedaleopsis nitida]